MGRKAKNTGAKGCGGGGGLLAFWNRLAGWKQFEYNPGPHPRGRYKILNSVNPCLADTITYLPISVTYAHMHGVCVYYTDLRAKSVRTGGVVAKLMKVSKLKVFFYKAEISYIYAPHR